MSKLAFLLGNKRIFLVGIGGISMSGIARYLLGKGFKICGSDTHKNTVLENLEGLGVKVYYEHNAKNVATADLVVYSSAISKDNPEIVYAKENGIKIIKRSELLGQILAEYKISIGVSGCHGKTTATAMLSSVLVTAGLDPTVFLGGEYGQNGNFRKGNSRYALAEACEYKKSFLDIKPTISVVLNIDNDHLESFNGTADMVDCFKRFVGDNLAVINADEKYAEYLCNCTSVTYGIKTNATYYATNIKVGKNGVSFTANAFSLCYGRINLKVQGVHNVYNALSAFATADILGVPFFAVKKGLEDFSGVKRRNEFLGEKFSLSWFADYAHHPTEIKATLLAFINGGKDFITVFQPHTYSRTELLMDDFIKVLLKIENLIVYKTYPAREKFNKNGDAKRLVEKLKEQGQNDCAYAQTVEELEKLIQDKAKNNRRILCLGAGDIYDIAKKILEDKKELK